MSDKTSKAKPKMADVTKPKKDSSADAESAPLVIQSRPIIGRATSLGSPSSEEQPKVDDVAQSDTPSAPTVPSQSKRTLIVPISDGTDKADAPAKAAPADAKEPDETPAAADPKADDAAEAPKEAAMKEKTEPGAADKPEKTDEPAEKPSDDTEEDKKADVDDAKAEKKDEKPSPETEKAVAEAAAAAKRQKELEGLIDSKQFYVPINAVARKREVKHSALMTIVVLLLAFVLIDLMLDSGLIFLAEKIPHTHFFTTSSIDQK